MIEILTVIAIIGVLLTITVVGLKQVGGNTNEKQTRTVLETMRSGLANGVRLDSPKSIDKFYGNFLPKTFTNFIRPDLNNPSEGAVLARDRIDTPRATTPVNERVPTAQTVLVLQYLASTPEVKAQLEGLPNQLRRTVYVDSVIPAAPNEPTVTLNARNNANPVIVPLDAWGNPIEFAFGNLRFVPPGGDSLVANPSLGGIGQMYSTASNEYWIGMRTPAYSPNIGGGRMSSRSERAFQAPDKGSFWISAGPDNKFETHDDNLYSFEGN